MSAFVPIDSDRAGTGSGGRGAAGPEGESGVEADTPSAEAPRASSAATSGAPAGAGPRASPDVESLLQSYRLLISVGQDAQRRDPERAVACFRQAAGLAHALQAPLEESRAWCLLGSTEVRAGRLDSAEPVLRTALDLVIEAASRTERPAMTPAEDDAGPDSAAAVPLQHATVLNAIGLLRLREGRVDDALASLREGFSLTTPLSPTGRAGLVRAETLEFLGMAYTLRAECAQALRYYEEALETRRAAGDAAGIAKDLNQLGNLRHRMGQYAEAVTCYRQALEAMRALENDPVCGDSRAVAGTVNNLASTLLRLGELVEARALFGECLARFRALQDGRRVADVLANLGLLAQAEGRLEEAGKFYAESLQCKREAGEPLGESNVMTNIAYLSIARGRNEDALAHAARSVALLQQHGIDGTLAPALVCRGLALLELNRIEDAATTVDEADAVARKAQADDQRAEVEALRAQVHLAKARTAAAAPAAGCEADAALAAARRSVALAEAVEDPELLAYASRVLGAVHIERGELEEAKQYITKAGRLMRGWTSSFERARVLFEEGRLLARTGAVEGAAEKLRRVEREFRAAGNPHWQLQALLTLAWVLRQADPEQAESAEAGARLLVEAHGLEEPERRIRRLLAGSSRSIADPDPAGSNAASPVGPSDGDPAASGAGGVLLASASLDDLAGILEQAVARDAGGPLDAGRLESVKGAAKTLGRVLDALLERIDRAGIADSVELEANRFELLVGSSRPMREIYHLVRQVAPTDSTVLVLGESGTGKELLARSIHNRSHRSDKAFAAINCPSIPRDLLESELFGHERGAFTGAVEARPGRIELAHEGTVFLDEVGDMPGPIQAKLLRFLQEREFERVGGRRTIRVDVRLLAATSRDLAVAMERGQFREDLYYRLNVVPVRMPALRERREDIPILVEHFLRLLKPRDAEKPPRITAAALDALLNHDWPGNVRELRNALEYMITIGGSETLDLRHLPASLRERSARGGIAPARDGGDPPADGGRPIRPGETLESRLMRVEAALIRATLEQEKWNQSAAARRLGITESMIRNRMKQYGIRQSRQAERHRGGS